MVSKNKKESYTEERDGKRGIRNYEKYDVSESWKEEKNFDSSLYSDSSVYGSVYDL